MTTSSFILKATLAMAIVAGTALTPLTANAAPAWQPQSSERLIKLPPSYLKKSLDNDFAQSDLGKALIDSESKIGMKTNTLSDLQKAVEQSDGDVRMDLRMQFLGEKRAYLQMMSDRNDLRRKHLKTKRRLFNKMLRRIAENEAVSNQPEHQEFVEMQDAARERFETSFAKVDARMFETTTTADTKYASQYSTNRKAMDKLLARINAHSMNAKPEDENGLTLTKKQHLRRMSSDLETELAMLEQEDTILGYMAKLVALDAMALAEDGLDAEMADADLPTSSDPAANLNFFLDN